MRQKGFSLIELLTVVAIIGILAAIGIAAYTGYVTQARKSSAENAMQQIALAQTEYYSNNGEYFPSTEDASAVSTCNADSSDTIEEKLFDEGDIITAESGYQMCIVIEGTGYRVNAISATDCLTMTVTSGKPEEC